MPRKEDLQMMSGEYFLTDRAKTDIKNAKKRDQKAQRKQDKVDSKHREFIAPVEDAPATKEKGGSGRPDRPDIDELKNKFLKKK
jgi:ribosomal RNA assembly protein